ncbi:histamine H3 receptor-like [Falco rusticolus]|uniref:histamine H3 receptor-like n=1 Tax=Falco rusticolus TaxID=120794 RepID=UPI0018868968|nr:histamine H3 receptor-like [Falco rusticolus]XP_055582608.1 histamine H3 receptor-like [Falco cherrug]
MGQDSPWLNPSGSPRAAGEGCAAGGQRGGPFGGATAALLAALMGLLVLATVLGNALVILAFVVDRSLRTQGNFFFLNLAIADLLVGGFCIPLYIPYVLTGEWRLGRGLCKLWLVVDYLVCTASVFNIVLISFDRFISVTKAVSYRAQKRMTRNAVLKMITVWIAAFLLYGPAILSWEHIAQKSILPEGECHAEFFHNWYFLMIASTIEFFTPFLTVAYFNLSIYLNIRKRTSLRNENLPPGQEDCEMSFQGEKREHTVFFVKPKRHKHEKRASSLSPPRKASRFNLHKLDNQSLNLNVNQDLPPLQVEVETKPHKNGFYKTTESICNATSGVDIANTMGSRFRLSRDKRVAKSLAIIVCVFGLCWAPYTLLMIIRAACHGHCVQHSLYETSFWLLWVNSAINPVLYPLCHMSFRKAFIKLLCPGKAKIHPHIFT